MVVRPPIPSREPPFCSAWHTISTPRGTNLPRNAIWETLTLRSGPGRKVPAAPGGHDPLG